jgi:hypothetical protein
MWRRSGRGGALAVAGRRIEEQALAQLCTGSGIAGHPLSSAYRVHLKETEGHEQRLRGLLKGRSA